jgi:lactoylglutathione lyase
MELTQLRLPVRDFAAVFRFYRDVIGLTAEPDDPSGPYAKMSFATGTTAIALQQREHLIAVAGLLPEAGAAVIAIRVDDLDAIVATLKSRGATFRLEPRDAFGRMRIAYLEDPEGNLIELQQWLALRSG